MMLLSWIFAGMGKTASIFHPTPGGQLKTTKHLGMTPEELDSGFQEGIDRMGGDVNSTLTAMLLNAKDCLLARDEKNVLQLIGMVEWLIRERCEITYTKPERGY